MNFSPQQYGKISDWLERLALAIVVGLVFQEFLMATSLEKTGLVLSIGAALVVYIAALIALKRT